jgi:hypothetical protein
MKNHMALSKSPAMLIAMSLSIISSAHRTLFQSLLMAEAFAFHAMKVIKRNEASSNTEA